MASKFKNLQNKVARAYEKKGMSKKKAEKIGGAVAYEQGVKKYGKRKFAAKIKRGRK